MGSGPALAGKFSVLIGAEQIKLDVTEFLANVESRESASGTLKLDIIFEVIIMIDDWMGLHGAMHSPVCLICWEPDGDHVLLQLMGAKTHQKMTPPCSQTVNRAQH